MSRLGIAKATAVATLSLFAVAGTATTAEAQVGAINFGLFSARVFDPSGGGGSTLAIDFLTNGANGFGTRGTLLANEEISGVFDPEIVLGTPFTIADLTVDNSSTNVVGTPISDFITQNALGGYRFSLTSAPDGNTFGPISLFASGNGTTAEFSVNGFVTGGDYGTRQVRYNGLFSAQFANLTPAEVIAAIDGGGTPRVSVSATFEVVPEPSTYVLLATGLGTLGLVARRRRNMA
jgi:hypothetical protein